MNLRQPILTLAAAAALFAQADVTLQRAMRRETLEGDLKGAIALYEKAVSEAKSDRATAAKALIRMADCYQKLGSAESRKIYERVLREYPDQKESVEQARARLTVLNPPPIRTAGMLSRNIWTLPKGGEIFGAASPDGRYVPYVDWDKGGDLFLHDLASGSDRRLTDTATDRPGVKKSDEQYAEEYAFSRDGRSLAYSWFRGNKERYELRVLPLDGHGVPQFRTLLDHEDVSWIGPHDWSPDGKWIAVQLHRKDKSSQIGLVSTGDGSLRILKSLDWRGTTGVYFSSDGKYLAYDVPVAEPGVQRDIYVLAVDGSREISAVVHPSQDAVIGWSPDGARLLFTSDRGGSIGLWALKFSGGNAQGSPELLKADVGHLGNMGVTSSGSLLYYTEDLPGGDIQTAAVDFEKGQFLAPPKQAVSTYVGTNQLPCWSRDGKYLAYVSRRNAAVSRYFVVAVRSEETGLLREFVPSPNFELFWALAWSADGKSLLAGGRDAKGRGGVFRIDIQTGQVSLEAEQKGIPRFVAESPDGKFLYYSAPATSGPGFFYVRRDLTSGAELMLLQRENLGAGIISPDGKYLAVNTIARPRHPLGVILVPTQGGAPRELMHVAEPQMAGVFAWAPDGQSVFVRKQVSESRAELWRVPIDAGQPTQLDFNLGGIQGFLAHPDGKRILFQLVAPRKPMQVWALENFLPSALARK